MTPAAVRPSHQIVGPDRDRERCVHGDPPLPLEATAIGRRRRRAHRVQDRGRRLEAVLRERGGDPGPQATTGRPASRRIRAAAG